MPQTQEIVDQYDGIIIGSGHGGKPLALALAGAGRKTALVERQYVGGTCINYGCTPTKTMVASGRVAYLAPRAGKASAKAAKDGFGKQRVWTSCKVKRLSSIQTR